MRSKRKRTAKWAQTFKSNESLRETIMRVKATVKKGKME